MKCFKTMEQREAVAYSVNGGQALHLIGVWPWSAMRGRPRESAHLFDQNAERLRKTAAMLGVRVLCVERAGQPGQHIDLCGKPLERAKKLCEEELKNEMGSQIQP